MDKQVRQLTKGAQKIAYEMVLMRKEMAHLQDTTEVATKHKTCKRRYVQVEETLIVGEIANLAAINESGGCEKGKIPTKRVHAERHYGHCGKIGYNSHTCNVEIKDVEDSNAFEKCYATRYSIKNNGTIM